MRAGTGLNIAGGRSVVKLLAVIAILCYPVLIYFGLTHFEPRAVGLLFVVVAALPLWNGRAAGQRAPSAQVVAAVAVAGAAAALVLASNDPVFLKLYPVCINARMLVMFAATLVRPPSMIERIARARRPDLPAAAVAYTRRVTWAWCVFFLLNAAAAAYTSVACSLSVWTVYNGLISYGLMGLMFGGEYCIRRRLAVGASG